MRYRYLLFFAYLLTAQQLFAQTDSLRRLKDSLLNQELDKQQARIKALTAERTTDSLKRLDLQQQLRTADLSQKSALLQALTSLKVKDSLRHEKQIHQIDSLRAFVKGFPVIPFRDTITYLFTRQGSFTAQERAAAINDRVRQLAKTPWFSKDSLRLRASEQTTDIFYQDRLLLTVSEEDAIWQNTSRVKLAQVIKSRIGETIMVHIEETRWQTVLRESLLALGVVLLVTLLIYGINRLFRWLLSKTHNETAWYSKGIRIKTYQLVDPARSRYVLQNLMRLGRWLFIILVIYLALPVVFGIFPFTRDLSETLLGYVVSPVKKISRAVWDYVPNLITILVLVIIFRYVLKFFRYLKKEIELGKLTIPGFYPDWANPTYQILRVLILAFMLIVVFPYMPGSESPVFKGVSVFVGLLFTFGSAGALGNIVAGLVLTYMRAFKLGDRVKIGEVTGDVIGKSLLVTRVRTIQNEIISIPNATVMNNHTINYSTDAPQNGLIVHTTVTIGYDTPWRQVHQLLIDAALATPLIEKEPAPYVLQTSLEDYYASYRINAYTKAPNSQARIYSDLHAYIQDKFNEAGVEITSPHYKALRDGNTTTIPADYLPGDYQAPGFHISTKSPPNPPGAA